jgi:hypothetical protein
LGVHCGHNCGAFSRRRPGCIWTPSCIKYDSVCSFSCQISCTSLGQVPPVTPHAVAGCSLARSSVPASVNGLKQQLKPTNAAEDNAHSCSASTYSAYPQTATTSAGGNGAVSCNLGGYSLPLNCQCFGHSYVLAATAAMHVSTRTALVSPMIPAVKPWPPRRGPWHSTNCANGLDIQMGWTYC